MTVQALIKTLYSDADQPDEEAEGMRGLIIDICDECADILREPDRSQSKAALKIVCSLIQTTRKPLLAVQPLPPDTTIRIDIATCFVAELTPATGSFPNHPEFAARSFVVFNGTSSC